ncbi:MAG TPA: HD domain-containing phosphohydrolase [Chthonomonadaceae bacterium]|nr:HD domain-containing phosphohydrolase [Chthonomonadaceae bacterium]
MKQERTIKQSTPWRGWFSARKAASSRRQSACGEQASALLTDRETVFIRSEAAERALERALRKVLQNVEATSAHLLLTEEATNALATYLEVGFEQASVSITLSEMESEIERYVLAAARPLMLAPGKPADLPGLVGRYAGPASIWIPLLERDETNEPVKVVGLLILRNARKDPPFTEEKQRIASDCADAMTVILANSRVHEGMRTAFLSSLVTLARSLEDRHPYSRGHSLRVAELCVMIARKLDVAPDRIELLRLGAMLHDIGKVMIPEAILYKPTQLSDEEFALVKQVPLFGYDLCRSIGLHEDLLVLIRNNHERLDGAGYPDGLKQGELPLPLRILCVVDAFDAMSSSRAYRQAISSEMRREQLNRFAGTQFDPVVVETLKGLLSSGALDVLYQDIWGTSEETLSTSLEGLQRAA